MSVFHLASQFFLRFICNLARVSSLFLVWCVFSRSVMSNTLQRILAWIAMPFSMGSSQSRYQTQVSHNADSLLSEPLGKHKNIGMGSLSLLQGILPAQGSNEDLLHCRQILYQLSYQGIPVCFLLLSNNIPLYVLAQMVKRLPTVWETQVWSLGRENPLEKEMATHSSTLAWKIPWTEEPCRLQSMVSQRVRHDWAASLTHSYVYISSVQSLSCV